MISYKEIQSAYVDLYKQVRNYIWGFSAVEALADLEIASYKTFPNLLEVRTAFRRFVNEIYEILREDEDLKKSVDKFEEVINSCDSTYAKLNQVREVVQV